MTNAISRNPATNQPSVARDDSPPAPTEVAAPVAATEVTNEKWASTSSMTKSKGPFVSTSRAQGALVRLVLDEAGKNHEVGTNFSYGLFSGSLNLGEEVGVRGSDAYRGIVAIDRRRTQYAEANPDTLWVKTRGVAGASVSFPLGGASLGFNGSVEISSIAAQPKSVVDAIKGQALSMVLPLRADGLNEMHPAPGTEWVIRGQTGVTLGNGVDANLGKISTTAGVAASISRQNIWTKNVKVLEDGKVFLLIGKHEVPSVGGAIGVSAGLVNVKDSDTSQVQRLGNSVEHKLTFKASVSGSVAWPRRQIAGAVLDLNNPNDKVHYDYLMSAMPLDAEAYIKANGLGSNYVGEGRSINTGVSLRFGSAKLLSTSTVRSKENGTLEQVGEVTQLGEASYNRIVEGTLARLSVGEERQVSVRAGTVSRDGVASTALAVRLQVSDPQITSAELAEHIRFAREMGAPIENLPDPASAKDFGRGDFIVEVAATDAQLAQLATRSADDVQLAFALAQRDIEGAVALPPWYSKPEVVESFRRQLMTAKHEKSDSTSHVYAAYANAFPGRDLRKDIASGQAVKHALEQAAKAHGKPVHEWGRLLEAIGMQASTDVRAALLALHRLSGAEATQLSTNAAGVRVTSSAAAVPTKTLLDLVGDMMLPQ